MLKDRIIATIEFFDLQDYPLTLLEIGRFLMTEPSLLARALDNSWELTAEQNFIKSETVVLDRILQSLSTECSGAVGQRQGFYFLKGRGHIVEQRLHNYLYGIYREQRIATFTPFVRHLPFVRSIALLGSQAFGQQKATSDIDLLIITDPQFLGIGRALVTAYFQIFGLRRHGSHITDRFCLNHYIAGPRFLDQDRNLYTAAEYVKLRPLVYAQNSQIFLKKNSAWLHSFFPNAELALETGTEQSWVQKFLESLFNNSFGHWLENIIKTAQLRRIKQGEFIIASNLELSFHPHNRKLALFRKFFKDKREHSREAV